MAQEIQLWMEYNQVPPFTSGFPQTASPLVVESVQAQNQPLLETRRQIIQRITRDL